MADGIGAAASPADKLAQTLKTHARAGDSEALACRGQRIGRYLVLGVIGQGAMGIVYRAYDPELNRKVALKVLRGDRDPQWLAIARVRLQREAQTLARLSHKNVVSVYDVGTRGADVFLAMEIVEGTDLQHWLVGGTRRVAEILDVLGRAGEGLAAAHEVGIVHRDFKPSNVLVATDGRVSVTDFGLARPEHTVDVAKQAGATIEPGESVGDGSLFDLSLTEEGRAVGTPAYMAPEQHAGDPADPRSDQYSFCIALHEALYGKRPFVAASARLLADAKRLGLAALPPARGLTGRIPRRVRKALARGLSPSPSRRFPRLPDLLAQLKETPRQASRRTFAAVAMAGVATVTLAWAPWRDDRTARCDDAREELSGVWDDTARASIVSAFAASGAPHADATTATITARLDRHADAWLAMHVDACEATWLRGEQSTAALDRRMGCLHEQRRHFAATVRVLTSADRDVVDHATAMLVALPDASACADPSEGEPAIDPAIVARVETARDALADIVATRRAGRHRDALARADRLWGEIDSLPHVPTRIDVEILHARLLDDDGRFDAAIAELRHAATTARAAAYPRAEAEAWIELTRIVGGRMQNAEQGELFGELALAAIEALGDDEALQASARLEIGELEFRRGHDDEAAEHIAAALEIRERHFGPDHYLVAETLARAAGPAFRRGDLDAAIEFLQRALAIYVDVFGEHQHPRLAAPIGNLGLVLAAAGRHDDALEHMRRARQILVEAYGSDHPGVAGADDSIGHALAQVGRSEDAIASFRAAIDTYDRTLGPDHPAVAAPLLGLGLALLDAGRPTQAVALLERANALTERADVSHAQAEQTRAALAQARAAAANDHRHTGRSE